MKHHSTIIFFDYTTDPSTNSAPGCASSNSEVPVPKPRRRLSVGQVDETELPGNQEPGAGRWKSKTKRKKNGLATPVEHSGTMIQPFLFMKPLMMGGDPSRLLWLLFPYQGHGSFVRGRMVKSIVANEKVGLDDLESGLPRSGCWETQWLKYD